MTKTNWVDFRAIKTKVTIEQILGHYGLLEGLKRKGTNLVGPCPIHKGTNKTQFHISLSKNVFNCFGDCHGGGNIIDFVAKMENTDIRQAALLIQNWFLGGPEVSLTENKERAYEVREQPVIAFEILAKEEKEEENDATNVAALKANHPLKFVLKNLDPDHPYLVERGLEKLTVGFFGLGFCSKGMMAGRIAIPIHNDAGELVAYVGRWPGDPPEGEPKYRLPAGFHKSLVLFNFHRAKEFARVQGLILVEGFFDCLRVWQAGFQNVVALLGSQLSEEQEKMILEAVGPGGKVSLMFDEDAAGWACRDEVLDRLAREVYVRVVSLGKEGMQPDKLGKEEIKNLLS